MAVNLPPCPVSLKPIAHYLKTAQEHDARDPVVSYWSRLYALQTGLKLSTKQADETNLLIAIMGWLETAKKQHHDNESITSEVVAQAYLENYAHKLFTYADQQDRAANFGKNVVKAFYTAGMIYDVLLTFGELSDEAQGNRKYAKFKAAYIHNCLKNGETPVAGPIIGEEDEGDDLELGGSSSSGGGSGGVAQLPPPPPQPIPRTTTPSDPNPFYGFQQTPDVVPATTPVVQPLEYDANKLPSPPIDPEEKNPGGFQPYDGRASETVSQFSPVVGNVVITPDQMAKAQKYCKWAGSALNYDDVKTAIENLEKGLRLLKTGRDE